MVGSSIAWQRTRTNRQTSASIWLGNSPPPRAQSNGWWRLIEISDMESREDFSPLDCAVGQFITLVEAGWIQNLGNIMAAMRSDSPYRTIRVRETHSPRRRTAEMFCWITDLTAWMRPGNAYLLYNPRIMRHLKPFDNNAQSPNSFDSFINSASTLFHCIVQRHPNSTCSARHVSGIIQKRETSTIFCGRILEIHEKTSSSICWLWIFRSPRKIGTMVRLQNWV